MPDKKPKSTHTIGLNRIKMISFRVSEIPIVPQELKSSNLVYTQSYHFELIETNTDKIICFYWCQYRYKDEKYDIIAMEGKIAVSFSIIELEKITPLDDKTKKRFLPADLEETLLGLTVSTARGSFHTSSSGYNISRFPIPLVNPRDIIEEAKKENLKGQEAG